MPMHDYECEHCGMTFSEYHSFKSYVSTAECHGCSKRARKVWGLIEVVPDTPAHYNEQLDAYVTGRASEKAAMRRIYEKSEGKVNPDWR